MFSFRRWLKAQVAEILKEISLMRAATQHLTTAVSALAVAVVNCTKKIEEELAALKAAHDDDDDDEVEAAAGRITALTSQLTEAAGAANTAVQQTPADSVPGSGPVVDPAAQPSGAADVTGRDPASGAPAGQGAVGAGVDPNASQA